MALYYKWDIERINLYPFGGLVKFNMMINTPIKEEFNILIMGLLFQTIFYLFSFFLYDIRIIRFSTLNLIENYHYSIFFFNLIPIFPLDGAKLLNIIFSLKLPFKLSHKIMTSLSFALIALLIYIIIRYYFNINLLLIILLLLTKTIEEQKHHNIIFNKFLLERYLNVINFKKIKYFSDFNINNMFRGYRHLFKINNMYVSEKEVLKKKFKSN